MSILPLLIKRAEVDGYLTDRELEDYVAQIGNMSIFDDEDDVYLADLEQQYEEYLKEIDRFKGLNLSTPQIKDNFEEIENRSDSDVI